MSNDNTIDNIDTKSLETQIDEKLDEIYNIKDISILSEYKKEIEDFGY